MDISRRLVYQVSDWHLRNMALRRRIRTAWIGGLIIGSAIGGTVFFGLIQFWTRTW